MNVSFNFVYVACRIPPQPKRPFVIWRRRNPAASGNCSSAASELSLRQILNQKNSGRGCVIFDKS